MGIFKNDDQKSSQFGFDEKMHGGQSRQGRTLDLRHHGRLGARRRHRTAVCARQVPRLPNDRLGLLLW